MENFVSPVLKDATIELTTKEPKAPQKINNLFILNSETGYASISVNLSSENVDGQPMNPANLYYQILLPGFKSFDVYTFEPENYDEITEPLTDIPYGMMSGLVFGTGVQRNMYVYIPDYDNIGARMVYKDETGDYYSEPVFYYPVDFGAVSQTELDKEPVAVQWFTIEGIQVQEPSDNGLYIRRDVFANGSISSSKILIEK